MSFKHFINSILSMFLADKEFEDLCFEFGIELEDIVSLWFQKSSEGGTFNRFDFLKLNFTSELTRIL